MWPRFDYIVLKYQLYKIFNQSTESTNWRFRRIDIMSHLQNSANLVNIFISKRYRNSLGHLPLIPIILLGRLECLDQFNTDTIASTNSQATKMVRKTARLTFISAS